MKPTARSKFDHEAFYAALDSQRRARGLNWKTVAAEAGVSASTLTRMAQGRRPDVDGLAALSAWAGLEPGHFIPDNDSRGKRIEPLAAISMYLRRDPNLSREGARAVDQILKATYEQFRKR